MISYLIDGALLVAVIAAGIGIFMLNRQVRRMRNYHKQYERIFEETGYAVNTIDNAVRDINAHGSRILLSLGERIDEAERLIDEIDERMDAVADHFEAQERQTASNVVRFAESRRGPFVVHERRQDDRMEEEEVEEREVYREQATTRAPKHVLWPTIGDRFSEWRSSEERQGWKAASSGGRW